MYESQKPVLIIVFNRPEQTKRIFEILRIVKPKRLYIAADAPRENRKGEVQRCDETLAVFEHVDWECKVYRKVNPINLGSHTSIPQAIDWFFDNEEMGIVLEDDCVPSISFFKYCDELLEKYRYDERVMWINGSNIGYSDNSSDSDYYFSAYAISWGWASWRRAWSLFDDKYRNNLSDGVSRDVLLRYVGNSYKLQIYWRLIYTYAYAIKNWDYRWQYTMWANGGLSCTPAVNLISNIGYGIDAVHGGRAGDARGNISVKEISGVIRSPEKYVPYFALDEYLCSVLYRINIFSVAKLFIASRFPNLRNVLRKIRNKPI
jgi:hypothetical protein